MSFLASATPSVSIREPTSPSALESTPLGPRDPAGCAGHARAFLHRHLHPRVLRHCCGAGSHTGGDAADAVGLPVRLCVHEPVPWRAGGQLRAQARDLVGHCRVHARLRRMRPVTNDWATGLFPGAARFVHGGRHRGLACGDPRHVSPGTGPEGHEPGDHLLWGGSGNCTHHWWLAVCPRGLAQHFLVPGPGRRCPVDCQLPAAARDPPCGAAPALQCAPPDAGLHAAGHQCTLCAAGTGQRRSLQWHVPVRAVGPRVSGGAPVAGANAVFLVFCAHHFRDHGRCMAQRQAGGTHSAQAPDPPRVRHHVFGGRVEPGRQSPVHRPRLVGPCAHCDLFFWLGADGARGDAAGAGPLPRAARHGLVHAGVCRFDGQWAGGGPHCAAGDAFHGFAGTVIAADVVHWHAVVDLSAPSLARDRPHPGSPLLQLRIKDCQTAAGPRSFAGSSGSFPRTSPGRHGGLQPLPHRPTGNRRFPWPD